MRTSGIPIVKDIRAICKLNDKKNKVHKKYAQRAEAAKAQEEIEVKELDAQIDAIIRPYKDSNNEAMFLEQLQKYSDANNRTESEPA